MRLLAATVFFAALPACGWAHAALKSAAPSVGAVVASAPSEVSVEFDGELADSSTLTVQDGGGKRVDDGRPLVAGDGRRRLSVGIAIPEPGTFRVDWHAVDAASHETQGHYVFTVDAQR